MTAAEGTVLAAIIAAAVVAGTFLATEIIRLRRDASMARATAIAELIRNLDDIPRSAVMKRRYLKKYYPMPPDFELMSRVMQLLPLLPKRDRVLVPWLSGKLDGMLELDRLERTKRGAQMTGLLILYLADRKLARKRLAEDRAAVRKWLDDIDPPA